MDGQDVGQDADSMRADLGKTKLQLPLSCDPPGSNNPPKQLVWIVSRILVDVPLVFGQPPALYVTRSRTIMRASVKASGLSKSSRLLITLSTTLVPK